MEVHMDIELAWKVQEALAGICSWADVGITGKQVAGFMACAFGLMAAYNLTYFFTWHWINRDQVVEEEPMTDLIILSRLWGTSSDEGVRFKLAVEARPVFCAAPSGWDIFFQQDLGEGRIIDEGLVIALPVLTYARI
jgi:hypothetical protein